MRCCDFPSFLAALALSAGLAGAQRAAEDAPSLPAPTRAPAAASALPLAGAEPVAKNLSAIPLADASWRTPIHSEQDDPEGGAYGTWAAGNDYKVSFHDGFTFVPYLGAGYPVNRPLHWQTESVRAGGQELIDRAALPARFHTDWRYEFRHGAVSEVYDVLAGGVEQSFVLHEAPGYAGDVVVTARLTTSLWADPVIERHGALVFSDEQGNQILSYGEAFAFDADGRRTAVLTSYDDGRLRLTLAGSWLARASFPVTIDPLTSNVNLAVWGGTSYGAPSYPDVARDDETNQVWVSYSRAASASDFDTWGRLYNDDFSLIALAFTDITTSWSTRYNQVAFVGGASAAAGGTGRWIVALQREFTNGYSRIRAYIHDMGDTTLNNGTTIFLSPPASTVHQSRPSVGGTAGFSSRGNALIAYQQDDTGSSQASNTSTSDVWGVLVDCNASSESWGIPANLETVLPTNYDAEWPCVSRVSDGGTSSWIVVWQEYNNAITGDDWDIITQRVESDGSLAGRSYFGSIGSSTHKVLPKVEGRGERYLVAYTTLANTGTKPEPYFGTGIEVQRFDWSETSSSPVRQSVRTLDSIATEDLSTGQGSRGVGFDSDTASHWAVAWYDVRATKKIEVARLGYSGAAVERATAASSRSDHVFSPSVVFNDDDDEFQIVWASDAGAPTSQPIVGTRLQYFPALAVTYGTGCAGFIRGSNNGIGSAPFAGSEFFQIALSSGLPSAPTALYLSIGAARIPLGSGCYLNLDPRVLLLVASGRASSSGAFSVTIPLPDDPLIRGDVFCQYLQLDVRRMMITSTRGLRVEIR